WNSRMSLQYKVKSKAAKGYFSKLGWAHGRKDDVLTWEGLYGTPSADGNRSRKVPLNVQESTEAVVRKYGTPERGRAERQLKDGSESFETRCMESRISRGTASGK
ncbi:hypothetical protein, partial [Ferviditalea candida]|nr:hypothetical protein [Paenibacillaceae bacterium T2]